MYRCKARKKYSVDCKSEEEVVLYSVTISTTVRPSAAVMRLTGPFHSTPSTTPMKKIFDDNSLFKGELNLNPDTAPCHIKGNSDIGLSR